MGQQGTAVRRGKKPIKNTHNLVQPRISEGSERSCEHTPQGQPAAPVPGLLRDALHTLLTARRHNGRISPMLARLETLEINDQKKESI